MNILRLSALTAALLAATATATLAAADGKLTGTPIGTERCWNYESNKLVLNQASKLFDGNLYNYFATEARSYTWAGLDLGEPHVITRVGWAPRNDSLGPGRMVMGVFQGANSPDFLDAVPIYLITEAGTIGRIDYADVDCSKGFRYVRYVGPSDARCNVAELEFYGHPGEGTDDGLYQFSNLPTVVINTVNAQEPYDKEHNIISNIIIIDDRKVNVEQSGSVRERGNASRAFPKKPWRIKFDKKQKPLDAPAKAKKWTLINNYGDKSLMRNILAFEVARRLGMSYVPYCHPVDVVLNGEFKGCYQLCDQVEVNPGRLEITEMTPDDIEGEALTGGYFIEIDAYADQEKSWFRTSHATTVTIKSPDEDEIVPVQKQYIKNHFQKLENAVYNIKPGNVDPTYLTLLDRDSFLRHFMVNEFTGNTDTYWSVFLTKERSQDQFEVASVWDFDLGFDNDNRTYPVNNVNGFLYANNASSAVDGMKEFVRRIIQVDPESRARISQIWTDARENAHLNAIDFCAFVDQTAADLEESQQLNFKRWPILSSLVHQNPRAPRNYKAEITFIKNFIRNRFAKYDDPSLFNYDETLLGLETVAAEAPDTPQIIIGQGTLSVPGGETFEVYTPAGALLFRGSGTTSPLPSGLYILSIPSATFTRKIAL